jgi:hypothetical protein
MPDLTAGYNLIRFAHRRKARPMLDQELPSATCCGGRGRRAFAPLPSCPAGFGLRVVVRGSGAWDLLQWNGARRKKDARRKVAKPKDQLSNKHVR